MDPKVLNAQTPGEPEQAGERLRRRLARRRGQAFHARRVSSQRARQDCCRSSSTRPRSSRTADPVADKPIKLQLTAAGRASPMLRLSDKEEENAQIWSQLPPVYWVAKVSRPKPAAEVLLVDPDPAKESRFGKMPVIAVQQYGLGQVMFVGTDNTWRWRKNAGDFLLHVDLGADCAAHLHPAPARRVEAHAAQHRPAELLHGRSRDGLCAALHRRRLRPGAGAAVKAFLRPEEQRRLAARSHRCGPCPSSRRCIAANSSRRLRAPTASGWRATRRRCSTST